MGSISDTNTESRPRRTIETPRLILRGAEMSDAEDLYECLSDIEVMRYWSTLPHTDIKQTYSWIESTINGENYGVLDFVICLKNDTTSVESKEVKLDSGARDKEMKVIGKAGIWQGDEIGFQLNRMYWGMGFAVEAVSAVLDLAFEPRTYSSTNNTDAADKDEVGSIRKDVVADVDPRNTASLGVLKKLGFEVYLTEEKTFQIGDEWVDSAYLSLKRGVWQQRRMEIEYKRS